MSEDRSTRPGLHSQIVSMFVPRTWKWVVITFSYYVILHLGTHLLIPNVRSTAPLIWSFLALEMTITVYLGWKTSDNILVDVAIAAFLYAAIVDVLYRVAPEVHTPAMAVVRGLSYLIIGSLGSIGAILGRFIRLRQSLPETQKTPA